MNTILSNLSKARQRRTRKQKKVKRKQKTNRLKRSTRQNRKNSRRQNRRRQVGGDGLPIISFKKGTRFFKGSLPRPCTEVLKYHGSLRAEPGTNACLDGSSIWLGPNEGRSREYYDNTKNWWNVFELKKDLEVLLMDPVKWTRDLIKQLIQEAASGVGSEGALEGELSGLRSNGGLVQIKTDVDFPKRLTKMCCMIFGIDVTVQEQKSYLEECLAVGDAEDPSANHPFKDTATYGWTATPALAQAGTTTFYDYLHRYITKMKDYTETQLQMRNQRLSYLGFDTVFLSLVCRAGYVGYYFPPIESIHEDAGEELAIFDTISYLDCRAAEPPRKTE